MPNLTIEEVLDAPYVQYPLRYGMVCPASDGACAMLFTTEEKAKDMCDIPVYVNGVASVANESAVLGYDGAGSAQAGPGLPLFGRAREPCDNPGYLGYRRRLLPLP